MIDGFLSLLYPWYCPLCGLPSDVGDSSGFCTACLGELHPTPQGCHTCGAPGRERCASCTAAPPCFRRFAACLEYRAGGRAGRAISRWKYGRDEALGGALCRLFAGRTPLRPTGYDLLVPVPSHPDALRTRGFNPALELARALARTAGGRRRPALETRLLQRISPRRQAALGRRDRRASAVTCFAPGRGPTRAGASALLIDDVLTTGATAGACAAALRELGVAVVDVATLAYTPPSGARPADERT